MPYDCTCIWNLKIKIIKKSEQKQTDTYREHVDGYQMGGQVGGWVKRVRDEEVQIGGDRIVTGMESTAWGM